MNDVQYSIDRALIDLPAVHNMLCHSYWSSAIPIDVVANAIANSECVGAYREGRQIGFARFVTDRATFAYLCDVIVHEDFRGRGVGSRLVRTLMDLPFVVSLRRIILATRDAHSVYEPFGFKTIATPEAFMEVVRPNIYEQQSMMRQQSGDFGYW